MRTITQAAKDLNVSRKKIYNEIEKLKISTKKEGKNNYILDEDFQKIVEIINEESPFQNSKKRINDLLERDRSMIQGKISDREYTDFKERIKFLEEQIHIKDKQLQDKDYQINGLIQSTFNFSKALMPGNNEVAADKEKTSFIKKIFKKKA